MPGAKKARPRRQNTTTEARKGASAKPKGKGRAVRETKKMKAVPKPFKDKMSGKKKGGTLDKKTLGPVAFGVAAVAWLLVSTRGALCRFATHAAIRAGQCNPGKVWNPLQTAEATTAVNWAVIAFMVGTAIFNPIPEKARVHV